MFGMFKSSGLVTLTPQQVQQAVDSGEAVLVDVREDHEWASVRVPGAFHAPLSRLDSLIGSLPQDRKVIFYCAGGVRSAKAVDLCKKVGAPHDTHMGGGIGAWMAHGLPVER